MNLIPDPILCAETAYITLLMIREGFDVIWQGLTQQRLHVTVYGIAESIFAEGWFSLVIENSDGTACVLRDGRHFAFGSVAE